MRDFVAITKALSDNNRIRALLALRQCELCVCQIIELLNLAPSTVSKHMSILKQARLVEGHKNGRWMFYRLADKDASKEVRQAIDWACKTLSEDPQIVDDTKRLKDILDMNPVELCKQQSKH